ncbi:hypothetical protein [Candidatus Cyanaurora vandensis]|uniref:hypothetical protein n=1 Tax=Candidatus Cyanaurora vandensis TaxID=2714958 RepID=UPI00257A9C04|nr:hypothetical protein [Candidatus Cyanaurora vandensis]
MKLWPWVLLFTLEPLPVLSAPETLPVTEARGQLKIINRTGLAVRLVIAPQNLLPRSFHWDLIPQAGNRRELRLELEGRSLVLTPGDVLAAFTGTDHWGPWVVGRATPLVWNERKRLWTLTLTPGPHPPRSITQEVNRLGPLRVGNATPLPVRVVLTKTDGKPQAWDLAPRQASNEGQELITANTPAQAAEGDLLLIFATDGSRRYWGPNVLGFTPAPFWDSRRRLWTTVVRP